MSRPSRFLLFVCFCTTLLPLIAAAQAPLAAASYVISASPTASHGSAAMLPVQSGVISYLRFDLSRLSSAQCMGKVKLRLYVTAVVTPGMMDVREVTTTWDEREIAAINAPLVGKSLTGNRPVIISASDLNHWVEVDLTDLVRRWLSSEALNNGIALQLADEGGSAGSFSFEGMAPAGGRLPQLVPLGDKCTDVVVAFSNVVLGVCVKADEACQKQDKDEDKAKNEWDANADSRCAAGACDNPDSHCVRKTEPKLVHEEIKDSNDCVVATPKGCRTWAIGTIECECKKTD